MWLEESSPKHWKYNAQNQRLPPSQTNFGTRKTKQNKTKKETKKADAIVWEIRHYYSLIKSNSETSKASLFI